MNGGEKELEEREGWRVEVGGMDEAEGREEGRRFKTRLEGGKGKVNRPTNCCIAWPRG